MTAAQYHHYLKHSARWKIVRSIRIALDGGRCVTCFAANGERDHKGRRRWLEVHHRDYRWCNKGWVGGALREVADTATCCNVCHGAISNANGLLDFLDMPKRAVKMSVLLLLFAFFVILGMIYALYGWLALVLVVLAVGYAFVMAAFFYRA